MSDSAPGAADPNDPVSRWAHRLGCYVWMESRFFEVLGRWSLDIEDDRAAAMVATHSAHHGWRAEQWYRLLPLLGSAPPESFVAAPGASASALVAGLDAPSSGAPSDVLRLAGMYFAAIPALRAAYADHSDSGSPVSEAPTLRMLRIISADTDTDVDAGRTAAERLAPGAEGAAQTETHLAGLRAHSSALEWPDASS